MPARTAGKFLGILLAVFLVISAGFTYQILTEATALPQNVRVTNITENSLTLSWVTSKPTWGYVLITTNPAKLAIPFLNRFLVKVFADDHRQISTVHHVTLYDLDPKKHYSYRLATGLFSYKLDAQGNSFPEIKLSAASQKPSLPYPAYGKVVEEDEILPAEGVIVYINNKLSTLTNTEGNFSLDLSPLESKGKFLDIEVEGGEKGRTQTKIPMDQIRPTPLLILKK